MQTMEASLVVTLGYSFATSLSYHTHTSFGAGPSFVLHANDLP